MIVAAFLPNIISNALFIVAAFYIMADYRRRARIFYMPHIKLLFGMFLFSFFIAAFYKNYEGMGLTLALLVLLTDGLYLRTFMTRRLLNQLLDVACIMSLPGILMAVFQKAATFVVNPSYRPVSFYFNANYFGMMIEFTVLIALYRAYTNRQFRPLYAVVVCMNLMGLYLCGSMSALVAMTCGVLLFLLYKHRYKVTLLYVTAMGAAFYVVNTYLPWLYPRMSAIGTTTDQRLSIWHGAILGFLQTPIFGRGMHTYNIIHDIFGTYPTYHCHNLILDCLLNYGIVGSAILAVVTLYYLREVIHQFRTRKACNAVLMFTVIFIVTLIHGCTDVTICWTQTGMLFLIAFSATGICTKKEPDPIAIASYRGYFSQPEVTAGYLIKD